jgi:hypothetical protein
LLCGHSLVAAATAVSVALNVAHDRLAAQLFAALPPVALLGALELLMSVARTGLPHTSRTASLPQPAGVAPDAAAARTPSGDGRRHPAALAPAVSQDRTRQAEQDVTAAPDARTRVRVLVARERAGGPTVTAAQVIAATGRSRRRAYELLRDARAEGGTS